MVEIRADETLDDLILSGLKIIQKKEGFRFAIDAVLLAHFASLKKGDRVIDLGTGTGVLPLLLSAYLEDLEITAVEIQQDLAEMATRSIILNKLEQIKILAADFRNLDANHHSRYSLVIANPPYYPLHRGKISVRESQALARHELKCNLPELVATASRVLKNGGRFSLIYRSERLVELFGSLAAVGIEPKRLRPIYPKAEKASNLVLVEGIKAGKTGLNIEKPLVIYNDLGEYTQEVLEIYAGGEADV